MATIDIMGNKGWLRYDKATNYLYSPSKTDLVDAGINDRDVHACVHFGYRMWRAEISVSEFLDCVQRSTEIQHCESKRKLLAISEARICLFENLAYPVNKGASQEYASHVMAVDGPNGYWQCDCGRSVPIDGNPCICGKGR